MQVKVCTKCGIEKPLSEFYKHKGCCLGIDSQCKKCKETARVIWRKKNKKKVLATERAYRENNRDKYNNYSNNYIKEKRKTDIGFKLNINISLAIRKALGKNKNGRHWEDLVGYTLDSLKKHLEKLFTEGMNWNNYGDWHIDHKIPKSVFNFAKPEHRDFKRCWDLKNLQPMWAHDNVTKNAKLDKPFQPSLLL